MDIKRFWSALLSCALILGCCIAPAGAADIPDGGIAVPQVSGYVYNSIQAESKVRLGSKICLDAGDKVSFDFTYTPSIASVDFGVVAPDGRYYYVNCTNGIAKISITVELTGEFSIVIRNKSSYEIVVSGDISF